MGNSARKRSPATVLLVLGSIFAVLLIPIMVIGGYLQDRAQSYEQGVTEGGICELISAQISALISAYEGTSVHITVEGDGNSYTLTSGRIVLMLRCFQFSISKHEQFEVTMNMIDRAMIELGEPPGPVAIAVTPDELDEPDPCLPEPEPGAEPAGRVVAFGFAIGDDWRSVGHSGVAGSESAVTFIHQEALEWFRQRLLASHHGSQGNVSNKHEIP